MNLTANWLSIVRHAFMPPFLAVMVVFLMLPGYTAATQDITWVMVEAAAPIVGDNVEQAREAAIEIAEWKAIEEAVVVNISMETLLVNLKLSGSMIGAIPYAEIIESEIIEEIDGSQSGDQATSSPMYRIKMKAGVVEKFEGHDPSFQIDAALNRMNFIHGQEMEISLKTTKDCFYCIFILLEDQKVLKLIPNQYRTNNFLESNKAYTIPDAGDREKGNIINVYTPPDKTVAKEAVYVLALMQPFDFDNTNIQEGVFGIYNGQTAFIEDLIRQIVGIPLGDRAEQLIQYQISKAAAGEDG